MTDVQVTKGQIILGYYCSVPLIYVKCKLTDSAKEVAALRASTNTHTPLNWESIIVPNCF